MYYFWCAWYFFGFGILCSEVRMGVITFGWEYLSRVAKLSPTLFLCSVFGPLILGVYYDQEKGEVRIFGKKVL